MDRTISKNDTPLTQAGSPYDLLKAMHSLRIRNPGNKPVTARISDAMGLLETMQKPEGRPGHHQAARRQLFRTMRELQPLLAPGPKGESA